MPEGPPVLPQHWQQLTTVSGISPEVIAARGYRSILPPEGYTDLKRLGFSRPQAKLTPGLLLPVLGLDGQPVLYQYRPDVPRIDNKGRQIKYETPKNAAMRLDFAAGQRDLIANPTISLWIGEGIKKIDSLRSHGLCAIGLLGVWNWRGTNLDSGKVALADWELVALNGRDVYIVFDSDVTTKTGVQQALRRLQRFLCQRGARVTVVHLPAGEGGSKVGVDDYLLRHTLDELKALATTRADDVEKAATIPPPYHATSRGLAWLKPTRDGDVWIPLTNFTARLIADVVRDDGVETTREFEIEATLQGRSSSFLIPARQFDGLGWATEKLGAQAIIYPGQTLKEHVAVAIKGLSDVIVERRIFTHTGWRRNRDGDWYFFHGGGVLGGNGHVPNFDVALPSGLERSILPEPLTVDAVREAVQATLRLLDVAPDTVSVPIWGAIWRAVLGEADVSVHLAGPTGTGKTQLAALAQQHFGADFDARHLPGSWLSTGNALEALAFSAKDVLLVIDDFAPGGTTADIARCHREADRVLRAQGNLAGRGRLRADSTMRPTKPPRGLILSTGEDVPRGQSLRARLLVVEVSPQDVDWTRLTDCQADAARGLYAQAMAAYVRWLAPRYEEIRRNLACDIAALRQEVYRSGEHRRTISNSASLAIGIKHFLVFALDVGAISREAHDQYWTRCWTALVQAAERQGEHQAIHEPTRQFRSLLSAAIASGRAHVAALDGSHPREPGAWGWRERVVGAGEYTREEWQPQGRRVGWIEKSELYLEPEASYAEAQALAREQGESLTVSPQTLRKRLREKGLLASIDQARQTLTVRRVIQEHTKSVLHLHARSLLIDAQKSDISDSASFTEEERSKMSGFVSRLAASSEVNPTAKSGENSNNNEVNVGNVGFSRLTRTTHEKDNKNAEQSMSEMSGRVFFVAPAKPDSKPDIEEEIATWTG
jgi:Domain of unknown function (DUF3854)/Domain of unknown function (DUF927)